MCIRLSILKRRRKSPSFDGPVCRASSIDKNHCFIENRPIRICYFIYFSSCPLSWVIITDITFSMFFFDKKSSFNLLIKSKLKILLKIWFLFFFWCIRVSFLMFEFFFGKNIFLLEEISRTLLLNVQTDKNTPESFTSECRRNNRRNFKIKYPIALIVWLVFCIQKQPTAKVL